MQMWRLYTEYKDNLANLVLKHFSGATILPGTGIWQGGKEQSACIEIASDSADMNPFKALAEEIKAVNHQKEVLVTRAEVLSVTFSGGTLSKGTMYRDARGTWAWMPNMFRKKNTLVIRRYDPSRGASSL
jgi:hypothetical protein